MHIEEFKKRFSDVNIPCEVVPGEGECKVKEILYFGNDIDGSGFCIGSYFDTNAKNGNLCVRYNGIKNKEKENGFPTRRNGELAWFVIPKDKEVLKVFAKELLNIL